MNKELIEQMAAEGYISCQKHPEADLHIYNYTARAQYERVWNEATLSCRGLIVNGETVVARPFRKFFNIEEMGSLPSEPFHVFDKVDGSLGILYFVNGKAQIATRGSFTSEQAVKGTSMLYEKYAHCIDRLDPSRTYLFEIIYPSNRIVCNYGDKEDLILLAIVDTATGKDLPLEDVGFPVVERFDGITDISKIRDKQEDNKEGFVILFESGVRVKVKYAEYVRLHRIVTQVSSKVIWEHLSQGLPMQDFLDRVPDEFYNWVRNTEQELRLGYSCIEKECKEVFKDLGNRKENALYYKTQKHPQVLFKMLDRADYSHLIWKMIRPEYARPFKLEV